MEGQQKSMPNCDEAGYKEFSKEFAACYKEPWAELKDPEEEDGERCEAAEEILECLKEAAEVGSSSGLEHRNY